MCVLLKQVLWDGYYAYYYKNTANYSYLKVRESGLLTCNNQLCLQTEKIGLHANTLKPAELKIGLHVSKTDFSGN